MKLLDFFFGTSQYDHPESAEASKSRISDKTLNAQAQPKVFIDLPMANDSRMSSFPTVSPEASSYGPPKSSYEIHERSQLLRTVPAKSKQSAQPKRMKIVMVPKFSMKPVKSTMVRKQTNSKRKFLCIIALIILIVVGCAFGVMCYYLLIEQEDLPDVTQLCQKVQTSLSDENNRDCFYHTKPYPTNCKSSECDTVLLSAEFVTTEPMVISFTEYPYNKINHLIDNTIPNQTPCDVDRWCMDGECVRTNDERVTNYASEFANMMVNGHWRTNCREFKCIDVHVIKTRIKLKNDSTCYNSECNKNNSVSFQIGFRSCNNPKPANNGQKCWTNESLVIPLTVVKICNNCNVKNDAWDVLSIENNYCVNTNDGNPCKANNDTGGVCLYGLCVPIGDNCE